ncbi:hypothetical protein CHLNCDRAFT_57619 [Chlorella variabilis]|uniref:Solute carrier family 40 protein n=1 Tax=Chlorella variabilis TaxID=554065 RepID=E1ZD93_CHLVA|nr:hypothetical protein CHLNCDRAFT_57619 [Chlorella variabilis]EFN56378.1 hypothetical protein CHLNCDRAFT_57619 [Chlorella variabilis]|eukprot:XP_005848480.1 hypothetical protein CHLNCDRAFT_57619 [Chlorella variabilis]
MGLLGFKVLVFSFVCAVCHPLIPTILKDCQPRLHGREVAPRLCPVQEWAASIPGTHSGASAADGPAGAGYDSLHPWRDSFARWREWPMAAMRVGTFGLGLSIPGSVLTQQLLVAAGAPDGADGWADVATHLASLLILSGAAAMLHHGLVWRVRLGLAAAVSAAIAACALPSNEHICSTELMSSPAAQRGTHQAYALVSAVACLVPLPISRLVALDGAAECGALLAWCQLGVGLLCPLLYEAVTTARLFRAHQQQREAAGLEREQGAHAALFEFIDGLTLDGCALHTGLICWALLSCAFDWCSYLAGAAGPAAQQQLV